MLNGLNDRDSLPVSAEKGTVGKAQGMSSLIKLYQMERPTSSKSDPLRDQESSMNYLQRKEHEQFMIKLNKVTRKNQL